MIIVSHFVKPNLQKYTIGWVDTLWPTDGGLMPGKILIQKKWPYSVHEYHEWISGSSAIVNSILPDHLRDFFLDKHVERSNRFFGEAIVLREMSMHRSGYLWYNSFQWLTWKDLSKVSGRVQKTFLQHLSEVLKGKVNEIRDATKKYVIQSGIEPKVSDISLLNKGKQSYFFEVKLPLKPDSKNSSKLDDDIHEGQLEGLALLKKHLNCSVGIIWLYPEGMTFDRPDYEDQFMDIYNSLG